MEVRCPISRHLLFRVSEDVELSAEIEIMCVCRRVIYIRDPGKPQLTPTETRARVRPESNPHREDLAHASTITVTGPH